MRLTILFLILFISCSGSDKEPSKHESYAKIISKSYSSGSYVPLVTDMDPSIDLNDAYKIQKYFVGTILISDEIAGYKTGLASKKGQSRHFVDNPISGVLFRSGEKTNNSVIKKSDYFKMLVETELGYRISEKITEPVKNAEELNKKISAILPVIELPDVRFKRVNKSNLTDTVAANICSSEFIIGKEIDYKEYGSQNLEIRLSLNGKIINSVSITDFMKYQKELLVWLINKQLENGWEIKPGQILITGAMEKINIGNAGDYEADYGPLGKVRFKVK